MFDWPGILLDLNPTEHLWNGKYKNDDHLTRKNCWSEKYSSD